MNQVVNPVRNSQKTCYSYQSHSFLNGFHISLLLQIAEEAFNHLRKTCEASNKGRIEVALMVDIMRFRKHISCDSKRQRHAGMMNTGHGAGCCYRRRSKALAFMEVGILLDTTDCLFLARSSTATLRSLPGVAVVSMILDDHQSNQ